jgi:hypothetical protein
MIAIIIVMIIMIIITIIISNKIKYCKIIIE